MNLAQKLNIESTNIETRKAEVANEIVNYFRNIFESGEFEKTLENRICTDDKNKRYTQLWVEFWDYHSGCCDTSFRVGYHTWHNHEGQCYESTKYKGIYLRDIQRDVGPRLLGLAERYLEDMGFRVRSENDESWLNYYKRKVTISW